MPSASTSATASARRARRPTFERVVDRVRRAAEAVGIDHAGSGAGFIREYFDEAYATYPEIIHLGEDIRATIEGLESPAGMPKLIEKLQERGLQGEDLA